MTTTAPETALPDLTGIPLDEIAETSPGLARAIAEYRERLADAPAKAFNSSI